MLAAAVVNDHFNQTSQRMLPQSYFDSRLRRIDTSHRAYRSGEKFIRVNLLSISSYICVLII